MNKRKVIPKFSKLSIQRKLNKRPERPNIKAFAEILSHVLPILVSIAFVASILLNQYIFSQWGLSFINVASPSDILISGVSGLNFLLFTTLAIVINVCFVSIANIGHTIFDRYTKRISHAIRKALGWFIYILYNIFVLFVNVIFLSNSYFYSNNYNKLCLYIICFSPVLLELLPANGLKNWFYIKFDYSWFYKPIYISAWIVTASSVIILGWQSAQNKINDGYIGSRYTIDTDVDDCDLPIVKWIGERALVVECIDEKYKILFNQQNVVFTPVPDYEWYSQFDDGAAKVVEDAGTATSPDESQETTSSENSSQVN